MFTPLAISYDNTGRAFVALMESDKYPFFGSQFHPEKQQYIYYPETKIEHTSDAIFFNRFYSDFFVNNCKFNYKKFDSYATEIKAVTENYKLIMTDGYYGAVYAF